jgi:hypothetical protein
MYRAVQSIVQRYIICLILAASIMTSEDFEGGMKILLATDLHLGYNETHPSRGFKKSLIF